MGRFYETSQRNFVDDFIYQPPWELAMAALAKKDQQVQDDLDTMEIMRSLPIDYWKGVDDARASELQAQWGDRINSMATALQQNMLDPTNRAQLMQARRDLTKDMTSGNIAKIQQNAQARREFMEKVDLLKNPADKAIAMKQIEAYKANNPNGAYSTIFQGEDPMASRNIWEEFTGSESFKNLKPDEQASSIENVGGQWMVTQGGQKVELSQSKIGQAFDTWRKSQSDLQPYGAYMTKWNGEQWVDENGQLRTDEGSALHNMMTNGIASLAYKKEATERKLETNPYAMLAAQEAMQIRAEQREEARQVRAERRAAAAQQAAQLAEGKVQSPELVVNTNKLLKVSEDLQQELKNKFGKFSKTFGVPPEKIVEKLIQNKDYYSKKYPTLYNQAVGFHNKILGNRKASKQIMVSTFGRQEADRIDKQVNLNLNHNTKMSLPLSDGNVTGKRYSLSDINNGAFKIEGIDVQKNSAVFGAAVAYVPGSVPDKTVVVKPLNFKDKSGVTHTRYVYIPFSTFTGTR